MKDELRTTPKHQLDHALPTVIHHPDDDLPILALWLKRAMANPTRFWSLLVALVFVVIGLTVLASGLSLGKAASDEAWTELELAKSAADRVKVAEKYPNTQAERWALLQAATEFYNKGFADLPANREVAGPDLKKALDLFERVARDPEPNSPQARAAAFGAARTLEARNELDKAVKRYEEVAKDWPDSDEGVQAKHLAELLRKPEVAAFYKELYAFKPAEVTLPPGGTTNVGGLPPGHPAIDMDSILQPPPPPPPSSSPATPKTVPDGLPDLPDDVFKPNNSGAAGTPSKAEHAKP